MARTLRLTADQQRRALKLAAELVRFALSLNDAYPFPPDRNHVRIEELAQALAKELQPKTLVRPKHR